MSITSETAEYRGLCQALSQSGTTPRTLRAHLNKLGIRTSDLRIRNLNALVEKSPNHAFSAQELTDLLSECHIIVKRALSGKIIIPDFYTFSQKINEIYLETKEMDCGGHVATYIPQLGRVPPTKYSISVATIDGQRFSVGDSQDMYCLQSTCKPFLYLIACDLLGETEVHQHVGRESSGRNFNHMSLDPLGRPHNPLINSGAIMCAGLILPTKPLAVRFAHVMKMLTRMCGGKRPGFANAVYLSERDTADRNFCLAYMMQEKAMFPEGCDLVETLELYFMCCSIEVDAKMMSLMAATLANGGICPVTDDAVLRPSHVQSSLSLMGTSGMYDFSGEFAVTMGFPAKSGVSGALLIVIPGTLGIATWSPPLDRNGNSSKGLEVCDRLAKMFTFHHFDKALPGVPTEGKIDPSQAETLSHENDLVSAIYAAASGNVYLLQIAAARGIDLMNESDYDQRTALHVAASNGHRDCVQFLLSQADTQSEITPKDRFGKTPVDDAVREGYNEIADLIRNYKAVHSRPSGDADLVRMFTALDVNASGTVSRSTLFEHFSDLGLLNDLLLDEEERVGIPALSDSVIRRKDFENLPEEVDYASFEAFVLANPFTKRALQAEVSIPDWQGFCRLVDNIYQETKPNMKGVTFDHIDDTESFASCLDQDAFGVGVCSTDGQMAGFGDSRTPFIMQDCINPILYCIATELHGEEEIHTRVGREASGLDYRNELGLDYLNRPHNPIINAGAMLTTSYINPKDCQADRFDYVMDIFTKLIGGARAGFSNTATLSQLDTADSFKCLAYLMRQHHAFPDGTDLQKTLQLLFQTWAVELTAEKMSVMAATLANGGVCPLTQERVFSTNTVKNCLSLLFSAGLATYSGEFSVQVGFPAKMSRNGNMMIIIPGRCGVCVWSPKLFPLESEGNLLLQSVRGLEFCLRFTNTFNVHTFAQRATISHLHDLTSFEGERAHHLLADLTFAISVDDLTGAQYALAHGVDLNDADYDGRTALHVAASEGHLRSVRWLLRHGANPEIVDRWGSTPLADAKAHNHIDVVDILSKAIANPGAADLVLSPHLARKHEFERSEDGVLSRRASLDVGTAPEQSSLDQSMSALDRLAILSETVQSDLPYSFEANSPSPIKAPQVIKASPAPANGNGAITNGNGHSHSHSSDLEEF